MKTAFPARNADIAAGASEAFVVATITASTELLSASFKSAVAIAPGMESTNS